MDADGGKWIPQTPITAKLFSTLRTKAKPFDWMYIDYNTLQNAAMT
jgi:hypothetical protein